MNGVEIEKAVEALHGAKTVAAGGDSLGLIHRILGGDPGAALETLPVVGDVMRVINIVTMLGASVWLIWTFVAGAIRTATDGELLGREASWQSFFFRIAVVFALLAPMPSGFSIGQIVLLAGVNVSVRTGNAAWFAASEALIKRAGSVGTAAVPEQQLRDIVKTTLRNELCVAAANAYALALGRDPAHARRLTKGVVSWGDGAGRLDSCGAASLPDGGTVDGGDDALQKYMQLAAAGQRRAYLRLSSAAEAVVKVYVRPLIRYETETAVGPLPQVTVDGSWKPPSPAEILRLIDDLTGRYHADLMRELGSAGNTAGIMGGMDKLRKDDESAGWLAAGTWYWQIARVNGAVAAAALDLPTVEAKNSLGSAEAERAAVVGHADSTLGDELRALMNAGNAEGFKNYLIDRALAAAGTDRQHLSTLTGRLLSFDGDDNRHPLLQLQSAGIKIVAGGIAVVLLPATLKAVAAGATQQVAGMVADKATGGVTFVQSLLGDFSGYVTTAGIMMVGVGLLWSIVIPLLPLLSWLKQVFAWLKAVLLAIISMPLWLIAHLSPGGREIIPAPAIPGYKLAFDVFARPMLLVISMLIAYFAIWPALLLVNKLFAAAAVVMSGGSLTTIIMLNSAQALIYCAVCYLAVHSCVKLGEFIPEQAARWIDSLSVTSGDK